MHDSNLLCTCVLTLWNDPGRKCCDCNVLDQKMGHHEMDALLDPDGDSVDCAMVLVAVAAAAAADDVPTRCCCCCCQQQHHHHHLSQ